MKVLPSNRPLAPVLHRQRGIALVVTLILLSVVTFLAVAFLFLARRERGAVATTVDMTAARRAADAATDHARAQIIASIIDSRNQFNYGLMVSTNFVNKDGFISGNASLTNVNYNYANGNPLQAGAPNYDLERNIANLFYSPRPPVFIRTDRTSPVLDFRFYHDLNNSRRFDTNGLMVEIANNGAIMNTRDTNGNKIPLTNFFVGDPEWVGVLERPDRPHSASNKFVMRWCFIVVPSGKTLDVNTLHNQSKFPAPTADGFSRNMGMGPWEMNLASFLVDLNTNVWQHNPGGPGSLPGALINPTPYFYDTTLALSSQGTAFEDALSLTRYRYGGDWRNNLKSVFQLYGPAGEVAFGRDGADGYGCGPLLLTNTTMTLDGDTPARVRFGWPGAENPNHFFTTQDLFDRTKTTGGGQKPPRSFVDRLLNAGYYGVGQYDRYTYYRLLSQLGTDSPTDPTVTNKLHLNYVNVDSGGHVIPDMQTNFVAWTNALEFFTNAADRLLRASFADTNANRLNFGVATNLSLANIPVFVNNRFVYAPSVHRILQVTANIWESTTVNRTLGAPAIVQDLPSVFRPTFRKMPNGDIYVTGFREVGVLSGGTSDPRFSIPLDLGDASVANGLAPGDHDINVYGVPWVIGAKKGLPNFNEFAMQSISQVTRKIQVRRPSLTARPNATNQLFIVGVSNIFAFEAWNSYRTPFSNAVQIVVANDMTLGFNYTNSPNDMPPDMRGSARAINLTMTALTNIAARAWSGYGNRISIPARASFAVPLQTNITFQQDSFFRFEPTPAFTTNMNVGVGLYRGYEQTGRFPIPQFTFSVSNRIRFIMIDTASQRVIDYVQLGDLNGARNLSAEATESSETFIDGNTGLSQNETIFWQTNRIGGNALPNPPMGVINQIQASLGNINVPDWNAFGIGQASGRTKQKEIDAFRNFMGLGTLYGTGEVSTNTDMQAPFTPTRKTSQYISWQANDPLVHYTAGDLANLSRGSGIVREPPNGPIAPIKNIGVLNDRFEPWGGRPASGGAPASDIEKFSLEAKDPGIKTSDNWDFPTNKFATLGLLGRVHRGTPWQTVYLKANDVNATQWAKWTGNANTRDATNTRPVMDRVLVDVFTTAIDQNTTRGQFNINQTGLAAMSALLGGVIGLTNSSTDAELQSTPPQVNLQPFIINPAGTDLAGPTNSILGKIHEAVNRTRAAAPFNGSFKRLGDILAVPELTTASPLLNTNSQVQLQEGINDAVYERLPQQLLGLMRGGDQPSFTIYSYGQALHPANRSIVTSGPYFGLCTNYQITAEFATRTVVEVQNAPTAPKVVVKSFNILPPE